MPILQKLTRIWVASRRSFFRIIFFLLLIGLFLSWRSHNLNVQLISPYLSPDLKSVVEDSLYQSKARYGFYIKSLKTGESFTLNEDQKFDPGSLYKLKLMVLVFEKIKDGSLKENKPLVANIKELNNYFQLSDDVAELTSGTINFTVKSALEQMITISHNYAALTLTKELKANNLAVPITAKEMGQFFEKIYKGEMIDKEYSDKMLALLKDQKINDRIPKLLPKETVVAHKTADLGYFEHDSGIVYTPNGDYIFVSLSESNTPDAAGARIAELSKTVYEYFTK